METTRLAVSPQGQLTIPKKWRAKIGKNKLTATLQTQKGHSQIVLDLDDTSLLDSVAGSAKGLNLWGPNPDEYIRKERASWDKHYGA